MVHMNINLLRSLYIQNSVMVAFRGEILNLSFRRPETDQLLVRCRFNLVQRRRC